MAIRLSYCTSGLTSLDFLDAIDAVAGAGYAGIEISFDRRRFNPFDVGDEYLATVRRRLRAARLEPACVATASHFFTPSRPHEPSLLALDLAGRKRRIDLIKRGIRIARELGAPLVSFGSGFVRDEHVRNPSVDPRGLLVESIRECLREIRRDEDITLLIEPEPGMLIETLQQGRSLIEEVDSPRFRLHVDICHAYCSEQDTLAALAEAAPLTRYLHLSDARPGYNLEIVEDAADLTCDPRRAAQLVYFPDTADYLLLDRSHPLHFCDHPPGRERQRRIDALLARAGARAAPRQVHYPDLYAGASPLDDEIFTYLISIPRLSHEVLERARPVIAYLRGAANAPLIDRMVANTLTGVAHFHEIPGEGTLDLAAGLAALAGSGFSGFGSVELYHHLDSWQKALTDSHRRLARLTGPH